MIVRLSVVDPIPSSSGHTLSFDKSLVANLSYASWVEAIEFISTSQILGDLDTSSAGAVESKPILSSADLTDSKIISRFRVLENYKKALASAKGDVVVFTQVELFTWAVLLLDREINDRIHVIDQFPSYLTRKNPHWYVYKYVLCNTPNIWLFDTLSVEHIKKLIGEGHRSRLFAVPHPPYWETEATQVHDKSKDCVHVTHIGTIRANKGVDTLIRAVSRYESYLDNENIIINLVGSVEKGLSKKVSELSSLSFVNVRDEYLTDAEYTQYLGRSDYICICHDRRFFPKMSGCFIDAMTYRVPLIASSYPLWIKYFNQYGPMGLMFDYNSLESLVSTVKYVSNIEPAKYHSFMDAIDAYRDNFSRSFFLNRAERALMS